MLIYSYINTSGNWENEKLCGNTTPEGRSLFTQFRVFPISIRVDQFTLFSNKISSRSVIDSHLPLHTIKCYPKDKSWITADIKKFISKRQKGWSTSKGGFPVLARRSSQLAASACMSTFIQSQG